jgi:D-glycero-alpha-D-manno-heptose-7-phosphate kinase
MIITKTPLRISFMGGGSDIPQFYYKHPGATISVSINKYVYLCLNKKFDDKIRISYFKTETVDRPEELEHTRAKECLKFMNIKNGIEIVTIADIPSRGTGLGSSSSFTVGLLKSLYAFKNIEASASQIAEAACLIEIDKLKEPIGKQDQYIASYGGLKYIEYFPEKVEVKGVNCPAEILKRLEESILLFYTGITRPAKNILQRQIEKFNQQQNLETTKKLAEMAKQVKQHIEAGDISFLGEMLHESWLLKKSLAEDITNPQIDEMYNLGLKNGAQGGKILGAGGGGFMMFLAPKGKHDSIKEALVNYKEMKIRFDHEGSKIIYINK